MATGLLLQDHRRATASVVLWTAFAVWLVLVLGAELLGGRPTGTGPGQLTPPRFSYGVGALLVAIGAGTALACGELATVGQAFLAAVVSALVFGVILLVFAVTRRRAGPGS